MISTPGQEQTEATKTPAPTLHSSSQVSDAPGKGILPMISGHMAAGLSLYHLDAQPIEQVSPLIQRQYLHGSQSTFTKWIMKKGAGVPLHHHAYEQITWITQGEAEVYSQGKKYVMHARRHHDHPSQFRMSSGSPKIRSISISSRRSGKTGWTGRQTTSRRNRLLAVAQPSLTVEIDTGFPVHASSNSRRASRFARISPCRFVAQAASPLHAISATIRHRSAPSRKGT